MNTQLKPIVLSAAVLIVLAGCNDNNKKDTAKVNSAPVAMSFSLLTQADTPLMDKVIATDEDGDKLTYAIVTEPSQGALELSLDGNFTYTPNNEVTGMDSFVYSANDGVNTAVTAMVSIDIEAQTVTFSSYSRDAFYQMETDKPLAINGREFIQDVTLTNAYDDLLIE